MTACRMCGATLLPEYEAIFGALIVGVEAAAYASLAICSFFLTMTGLARIARWILR